MLLAVACSNPGPPGRAAAEVGGTTEVASPERAIADTTASTVARTTTTASLDRARAIEARKWLYDVRGVAMDLADFMTADACTASLPLLFEPRPDLA